MLSGIIPPNERKGRLKLNLSGLFCSGWLRQNNDSTEGLSLAVLSNSKIPSPAVQLPTSPVEQSSPTIANKSTSPKPFKGGREGDGEGLSIDSLILSIDNPITSPNPPGIWESSYEARFRISCSSSSNRSTLVSSFSSLYVDTSILEWSLNRGFRTAIILTTMPRNDAMTLITPTRTV